MVTATASTRPVLTFQNFSLRCDKSDPRISFEKPWNWELPYGKKIALITSNSFLRYQIIGGIAGLVTPVSGEIISGGVIGWPVGGSGGLDGKLRISHAFKFLSEVYGDCLYESRVSLVEFWDLLSGQEIYPSLILKELSRNQKEFLYLSLSVLFSFDCYLIPQTRFLMSNTAKPLRDILVKQLEGKTLLATSSNKRFLSKFCEDGLVLSPKGEILFFGKCSEAMQWADLNLKMSKRLEMDDESFQMGLDLQNLTDSIEGMM